MRAGAAAGQATRREIMWRISARGFDPAAGAWTDSPSSNLILLCRIPIREYHQFSTIYRTRNPLAGGVTDPRAQGRRPRGFLSPHGFPERRNRSQSASHPEAGDNWATEFTHRLATVSSSVCSAGSSSSTSNVSNARPNAIATAIGIRNCA